jgi:stress responsive alpha/beta barrel protein
LSKVILYSKSSPKEKTAMAQVIERIILDKPRADVTQEELATANEVGQTLLLAIPGVEAVSFGIALSADEPYQWYVRIRFRDEQALETFNTHPNHLNFAEQYWGPLLADHSVRDYRLQY